MRLLLSLIFMSFLNWNFAQEKEQPLKNLFNEYHVSVNHGIGNGFFGGGLGANHVFNPDKIVSFRTGIDFQFFHVWGDAADPSHYSSTKDIRYSYVDLNVPIIMRINIKWIFMELGGNLGVGITGQRRATVINYSDYGPSVETAIRESWNSGISIGPVLGIGSRIPLNEKLDLLIHPDIGASVYFQQEFVNLYGRLCVGIHLK